MIQYIMEIILLYNSVLKKCYFLKQFRLKKKYRMEFDEL